MATVSDLGDQVKAAHPGAYDDMPSDSLGRAVQAKFPGAYDDFTDPGQKAPTSSPGPYPLTPMTVGLAAMTGRTSALLPSLGGYLGARAGSFAGPIGRTAGAYLGGGAGEAGRELSQGGPFSLNDIGTQANWQAATQGTGELLSKGLGALAGPFIRREVSFTTPPKAPPALIDQWGREVQPILDEWGNPARTATPSTVQFTRRAPGAAVAARAVGDAGAAMIPGVGRAVVRPLMRGAASVIGSQKVSDLATLIRSPYFQSLIRQLPRAGGAGYQFFGAQPDQLRR